MSDLSLREEIREIPGHRARLTTYVVMAILPALMIGFGVLAVVPHVNREISLPVRIVISFVVVLPLVLLVGLLLSSLVVKIVKRITLRQKQDARPKASYDPIESYVTSLPQGQYYVIAIEERAQAVNNAESLIRSNFLQHYRYRIFPVGHAETVPGMYGPVTLANRAVLVIGGITDASAIDLYVQKTAGARIVRQGYKT